jgi:hypothetical protein
VSLFFLLPLFTRLRGRGVLRSSLKKFQRSLIWVMRLAPMLASVGALIDVAGLISPHSM